MKSLYNVNSKFKKNKHTRGLRAPPSRYEVTPENTLVNKTQSELSEGSFYEIPSFDADISVISETLTRNRKHYLNQLERNAREEAIHQLTEIRKSQIKNLIEDSENTQDILDLLKKKHEWKTTFYLYDNSLPKICKVNTCSNFCLGDSEFCVNHIVLDPSNKLFIQCPKCHKVHPKNSECPI